MREAPRTGGLEQFAAGLRRGPGETRLARLLAGEDRDAAMAESEQMAHDLARGLQVVDADHAAAGHAVRREAEIDAPRKQRARLVQFAVEDDAAPRFDRDQVLDRERARAQRAQMRGGAGGVDGDRHHLDVEAVRAQGLEHRLLQQQVQVRVLGEEQADAPGQRFAHHDRAAVAHAIDQPLVGELGERALDRARAAAGACGELGARRQGRADRELSGDDRVEDVAARLVEEGLHGADDNLKYTIATQ